MIAPTSHHPEIDFGASIDRAAFRFSSDDFLKQFRQDIEDQLDMAMRVFSLRVHAIPLDCDYIKAHITIDWSANDSHSGS